MKTPRSLTQRVVWALTGVVIMFVTVLVTLAFLAFGRMEDELVNEVVRHETSRLVNDIAMGDADIQEGEFAGMGGALRAWLIENGRQPASMPEGLRGLGPGVHEIGPGGEVWHVRVTPLGPRTAVVVYDATDNEQRVYDFGLIVLVLGVVCVLCAYAVAQRIAERVVAPLHAVTDRLALWAPGAMATGSAHEDEAGRLIVAFNRVQQQVDRMIATEREFGANLSHEVRTPLAGMRSDAEMLLVSGRLNAADSERVQRMVQNVDDVTDALANARAIALDRPQQAERLVWRDGVESAWTGLADCAQAAGVTLRLALPAEATVLADRHALLTVLRNLMRNAIEHAAPATLTFSLAPNGLFVRDDGPGIAASDLPYVFDRYYSGRRRDTFGVPFDATEDERGLGLAIAKRVCDLHGWGLTVQSPCPGDTRGTLFELRLASQSRDI